MSHGSLLNKGIVGSDGSQTFVCFGKRVHSKTTVNGGKSGSSHHTDSAVLDLYQAKAVKLLLGSIAHQPERVKEAELWTRETIEEMQGTRKEELSLLTGAWAPNSDSKAMFRLVETEPSLVGANAATEAAREARIAVFMAKEDEKEFFFVYSSRE